VLACRGDCSFPRRGSSAEGCAGRHSVGVETNLQRLRYPRSTATRRKCSKDSCPSYNEQCSYPCGHAGTKQLHAILEALNRLATDHYFVLSEFTHQPLAHVGPPFVIDNLSHDFHDDHVLVFRAAALFPSSLCGRPREVRHSPESLRQFLS
jgi:hypothetical protein